MITVTRISPANIANIQPVHTKSTSTLDCVKKLTKLVTKQPTVFCFQRFILSTLMHGFLQRKAMAERNKKALLHIITLTTATATPQRIRSGSLKYMADTWKRRTMTEDLS